MNIEDGYLMKSGAAARYLGISAATLRKFQDTGILKPFQLYPSGHRRYSRKQLEEFLSVMGDSRGVSQDEEFMSSTDVCRYCGFSPGMLNSLEKSGDLKPRRKLPFGNKRLYARSEVDDFLRTLSK